MNRRLRSIWLVARREILERGRSRAYLLSLVVTLVLLGIGFALPVLLSPGESALRLGIVQPEPASLRSSLEAAALPFETDLEFTALADRAAADDALRAGTIDVLVAIPSDLSGPGEIAVKTRPDDRARTIVSAAVVNLRIQALLAGSPITPAQLATASALPATTTLEPESEADQTAFIFANAGVILMFIGIFSYGYWVLGGVVEEKQSRVVEVVLSTVRPRDLLMGKVFGIGILGMAQLLILVTVGLVVAQLSGRLTLPATTGPAIVQFLLWFVLGYTLYSTALGFLGALASRMEEASNASTPVTMVATTSYLVGLLVVIDQPDGLVARIATFFPPSAPMIVPLRAALGKIEPWEIVGSVGVTLLTIWVLFNLGARIYSGAVLSIGGRVRLRDAWRASED